MNNSDLLKKLKSLDACGEAVIWLGERDSKAMYNDCERGDWLLWLAPKINLDTKVLQFIYCAIARTSLVNYEKEFPNDRRPHEAIEAKEKWLHGEITDEELSAAWSAAKSAESAAWSAARSAESAAWSAAWSAASAASAAWSAAWSAASAASAARSAASAASAASTESAESAESAARSAASAAWSAARSEQANIFRSFISYGELESALNNE